VEARRAAAVLVQQKSRTAKTPRAPRIQNKFLALFASWRFNCFCLNAAHFIALRQAKNTQNSVVFCSEKFAQNVQICNCPYAMLPIHLNEYGVCRARDSESQFWLTDKQPLGLITRAAHAHFDGKQSDEKIERTLSI
jgi:hypothetical protein